jgi:hypothetical protein
MNVVKLLEQLAILDAAEESGYILNVEKNTVFLNNNGNVFIIDEYVNDPEFVRITTNMELTYGFICNSWPNLIRKNELEKYSSSLLKALLDVAEYKDLSEVKKMSPDRIIKEVLNLFDISGFVYDETMSGKKLVCLDYSIPAFKINTSSISFVKEGRSHMIRFLFGISFWVDFVCLPEEGRRKLVPWYQLCSKYEKENSIIKEMVDYSMNNYNGFFMEIEKMP